LISLLTFGKLVLGAQKRGVLTYTHEIWVGKLLHDGILA
jgi:hypothetical protein